MEGISTTDIYSDSWFDSISKYPQVFVYGAGNMAHRIFILIKCRNFNPNGIIVSHNPEEQRMTGIEWPIFQFNTSIEKDSLILVAVDDPAYFEVQSMLNANGYNHVIQTVISWYELNKRITPEYYPESMTEWFFQVHGCVLDLKNPKGFNEKICWLKLYDNNLELKRRLADKYLVKDWVGKKIGENHVVKTYGIWRNFDEIDLGTLPTSFVLKCTHGNGFNTIIHNKDKVNWCSLKEQYEEWMRFQPQYKYLELQYANNEHRIIAEEILKPDEGDTDLKDYKLFVFDGKVKMIQVDIDRFRGHRRKLFTPQWDNIIATIEYPDASDIIIDRPEQLDEMISYAEKLGKGFYHVRVDFYISEGEIYFGEMTFSHGGGMEKITPKSLDIEMGNWIKLPTDERDV